MTTNSARARSFDAVAASYAANRPSYPPALLDAIEELSGRPLAGARVADVGAGTGIATALLDGRGARVAAVEPGDGMAAQLRRGLPHVPVVRGDGNRLPLRTGSLDLITYAQSPGSVVKLPSAGRRLARTLAALPKCPSSSATRASRRLAIARTRRRPAALRATTAV
ncbi:class I SAM-dependent methyltransferase [Streptomyces microflavus]|uniref:class I SAM-dependent methyltransferase n=1 Tax=Streptomyces microflavus TaxID=1919 RepID=UPI0033BCB647